MALPNWSRAVAVNWSLPPVKIASRVGLTVTSGQEYENNGSFAFSV
jgi:hypothetical protein